METITKKLSIVMLTFIVSMFVGIQIHESGHEQIYKNFDVEYQQTNYKDFIPEESGFFLNTILSFL
jgi:hypothetical protein